MNIKLNCDMGEGFGIYKLGLDEELIKHIHLANLACGFHASDALTISKAVSLAVNNGVEIGAHPSYQDLVGFGRRSMVCSLEEIKAIVLYQIGALEAICKSHKTKISYVKPHGALYNDMMRDENIFRAIAKAISLYDANLKLMILSNSENEKYANIALSYGVSLLFEVFADRNYNDDGSLVSRMQENAVISDELEVLDRVQLLNEKGYLYSISGQRLFLKTDTLCVHGDNEKAISFLKNIKRVL